VIEIRLLDAFYLIHIKILKKEKRIFIFCKLPHRGLSLLHCRSCPTFEPKLSVPFLQRAHVQPIKRSGWDGAHIWRKHNQLLVVAVLVYVVGAYAGGSPLHVVRRRSSGERLPAMAAGG
jgi:hypothetical protein